MGEETISGLKRAFGNGSRVATSSAGEISPTHTYEEDLLIAVVILGVIVLALILIIIYGYCKYVKGGMEERRSNVKESTGGDVQEPDFVREIPQVPVKARKRSMTFTQNDEECRKYREDLADAYDAARDDDNEKSRKKSTVTFVGVE